MEALAANPMLHTFSLSFTALEGHFYGVEERKKFHKLHSSTRQLESVQIDEGIAPDKKLSPRPEFWYSLS